MSVEENIALIRRWFHEVWNEGRIETIHQLMSPNGVGIGQSPDGEVLRGPAQFVPLVENFRGAFPDMNLKVDDIFGSGDKVVVRWSAKATHAGDHLGVPATQKPVRLNGISILRLANGQILEGWDNWDRAGMIDQITAVKSVGPVKAAS